MAFNSNYCDLSLVQEAKKNVDAFIEQGDYFYIFVGHSLGGTAAQCLAGIYKNSRSIALNGGAAPTNPVLVGPGPARARFYHIFGDLISSHMSPTAAEVIRIAKKDREFGVLYPHSTSRFLASDGVWTYATADEEDKAWLEYGQAFTDFKGRIVKKVMTYIQYIRRKNLPNSTPIPGSRRALTIKYV